VRRGVGYALLAITPITWFGGLLAAPLLPLPVAQRAAVGGAGILIGEITFWAAIPFLGKEIVMLFRRWLNPLRWLRRRKSTAEPRNDAGASSPGEDA
jgi:hypothetical protein